MRGLPSVTLYIRRNGDNRQHYERVKRVNPQVAQGSEVYCLHFYENGKRKWLTVGNDLRVAYAARGKKDIELASGAVQVPTTPKPSPDVPKNLEQQREAFLADRRTTINQDGSSLPPIPFASMNWKPGALLTQSIASSQRRLPGRT